MQDVQDLRIDCPALALLHREVEGLDGDDPGDDVHGDVQVLHRGETITDIYCEVIFALKEVDVEISKQT